MAAVLTVFSLHEKLSHVLPEAPRAMRACSVAVAKTMVELCGIDFLRGQIQPVEREHVKGRSVA